MCNGRADSTRATDPPMPTERSLIHVCLLLSPQHHTTTETGRPAPKKAASAKKPAAAPVAPSAPEATAAAGGEMKDMQ